MRYAFTFILALALSVCSSLTLADTISANCTLNGIPLYGKVKVVDSFPDFKVQRVDHFADLKVQWVNSFPSSCGKWQRVEHFPDFTIQFVDHFPDFKIQEVSSFPGVE